MRNLAHKNITKRTIFSAMFAVLCAVVLLVTSLTPAALAARVNPEENVEITIDSTTEKAQTGAQAMLTAGMLKKCLAHVDYIGGSNIITYGKEGLLFSDGSLILWNPWDFTDVVTGPYVENSLTGNISNNIAADDGAIWCLEGNNQITFLKDFADTLGITTDEILCNPDGDRAGFIIGLDNNDNVIENGCSTAPRYKVNYVNGGEYLKNLYEKWREQSGYPFSWDDIKLDNNPYSLASLAEGGFNADIAVGAYWLYYKEFESACSFTTVDEGAEGAAKILDPASRQFKYISGVFPRDRYEKSGFFYLFDGTHATCEAMSEVISKLADAYMEVIKKVLAHGCYDAYTNNSETKKRWEEIVNNPSNYSDDTVKMAKDALKKYNELASDGNYDDFIEQDENGKWVCIDIGDVHITENDPGTSDLSENDDDACANSGSKLGWILCPIISGLQEILNELYENTVEPMLQINVSVFNTDNGVYQAWQIFQNIANIIFVIVFLFAIFSQITGFGIDNYGIKRLLPKLIVAAILVNLSFVICQALVDVSNIVGSGVKDLLMSIRINDQAVGGPASALNNFISGASIFVGVGGAVAAVVLAPGLLLGFLLGLVSVLISVLFMFVLLGIRQAGVIILVVVSPVAILMYMLPNTKSIFDKWKNIFQALLVLYPICGLMIGGCALASKVIISSYDDFWMALLGALLSVVPFFLVPKMTQGALSAMGKIGGMISGAGQKIGGAAQSAAKFGLSRSPLAGLAKNAQDRDQLRLRERERRRLTGIVNRINRKPENARTDRQKRQLAMAQSQLNRMTQEDATAAAGTKAVDYDSALAAAQSKRFNEDVAAAKSQLVNTGAIDNLGVEFDGEGNAANISDDSTSLVAQGLDAARSGDSAKAFAVAETLSSKGHSGREALNAMLQQLGEDGTQESDKAIQSISSLMMGSNSIGSYKADARSTYDYMKKAAAGDLKPGQTVKDFVSKVNFKKTSQEELVGRDHEELAKMAASMERGEITGDQADALYNVTSGALKNDRLESKREGKTEEYLQRIKNAYEKRSLSNNNSGARPGQEFKVQQGKAMVDTVEQFNQATSSQQRGNNSSFDNPSPSEQALDDQQSEEDT